MFTNIENTNGRYQINEKGDIKSVERVIITKRGHSKTIKERILKHNIHKKTGYHTVGLHTETEYLKNYVHKLVAKAFIPNTDNKPQVDHIDGNKDNNNVENLRWCTPKENNNFELHKKRLSCSKKGKTHKVKEIPVVQYDLKTNDIIKIYKSAKQASKETNINYVSIWYALTKRKHTKNGYSWCTKSAGGYGWKYLN